MWTSKEYHQKTVYIKIHLSWKLHMVLLPIELRGPELGGNGLKSTGKGGGVRMPEECSQFRLNYNLPQEFIEKNEGTEEQSDFKHHKGKFLPQTGICQTQQSFQKEYLSGYTHTHTQLRCITVFGRQRRLILQASLCMWQAWAVIISGTTHTHSPTNTQYVAHAKNVQSYKNVAFHSASREDTIRKELYT